MIRQPSVLPVESESVPSLKVEQEDKHEDSSMYWATVPVQVAMMIEQ